ncbi:MAG: hypothetical protein ABI543_08530 [Ignavibacteria bacterium]
MSMLAGEKFELKLLPSNIVNLHEECEDNRYGKLMDRFNGEKVLYNPLIVAKYEDKFILIDGANRFEALRNIGCRIILAQLVDYSSTNVVLKSWYHFVSGMSMDDMINYANQNSISYTRWRPGMKPESKEQLVVISTSNDAICLNLSSSLEMMLKSLSILNKYYENEFSYSRIDSDTDISDVKKLSPDEGLLFVFPEFSKSDIVTIAGLNQKLPAGISRHLIPNRVLHIKILIDALMTDEHLDKRNEDLEKYVQFKIDTKKVRLYREPLLVFDE